jgi:hypothetical protein
VESCSVLLEDHEGKISLLTNVHPSLDPNGGTPPADHDEDDEPVVPAVHGEILNLTTAGR